MSIPKEDAVAWILVPALCFICFVLGGVLGGKGAKAIWTEHWQREAVKRGFAEYNQTNGQWQWKQPQEHSDDDS